MKKFINFLSSLILITVCVLSFSACGFKEDYSVSVIADIPNGCVYTLSQTAKTGEKVRLSCLPDAGYKLTAYTVNGQYIGGNTFVMPNKNVEVSAEFEAVTYKIEYVLNGGEVDGTNPETYTVEDGDICLIAPHKQGFEFGYWHYYFCDNERYLDELSDFKTDTVPRGTTGELTLYAHYYNVPHEITVGDQDVNCDIYVSCSEAEAGEQVYLYIGFVYDYYDFVCFTVDGEDIEGDSFIMPNRAVTVSAKTSPTEFNITYELGVGANPQENPGTFNIETIDFELSDAIPPEGYEFYGWFLDGDFYTRITNLNQISYLRDDGVGDVTLYAEFVEIIEE